MLQHSKSRLRPSARWWALALTTTGQMCLIGTAAAQEDQNAQVEEVVVTAQHRTENLQTVPISAHVVSGQSIAQKNVTNLDSLSQIEPSVHINSNGRSSEIYIRGTGSGQSQFFDQSVGVFIDDIYHGRSRIANATFLDLERVEILKGPQSTFFGNNAIAGAFNIVTRKPDGDFNGWARVLGSPTGGTNGGQYAAEGAVNVPLNDLLSIRAAGSYNGQGGWLRNDATDNRAPNEENLAGRVSLRFMPSDKLDMTLKVEASRNRNRDGLYLQSDNCPPPAPFTAAGFCTTILANGYPTGLGNNQFTANDGAILSLDNREVGLTANYRLGEHTLTSVTGYYDYDFNANVDIDGTPQLLIHAQTPEHYHQFSQELRIASPVGGHVEYMAGVYFQTDHLIADTRQTFGFLSPTILALPPFAGLAPYLPIGQEIDYDQDEKVYSAFGSVKLNLTNRLSLTGGLRGTSVTKDYDWSLFYAQAMEDYGGFVRLSDGLQPLPAALGLGVPTSLSGSRTDQSWMPSARMQYQFTPLVMGYLSYAKGFKAGGFNGADNTGVASNLPFAPEHVDAYEAGLKSELLNRRLLLNLALFRSEYQDLQVTINQLSPAGSFISLVRNAARSISQGVEAEGRWRMSDHFNLSANISYIDAHYLEYPNATATNEEQLAGIKVQDLSGHRTQYTPRWSGGVTGEFKTNITEDLEFTAELTGLFSSNYYTLPTIDPISLQDGFLRLDARLTLASHGRGWAVDLLAKNLTDETIVRFSANLPRSPGSLLQQKEQPRNLAMQLRYSW